MTEQQTIMMLRSALLRLSAAIRGLARVKDGKTLFEASPTKDQECYDAWLELNNAQLAAKIVLDPDDEPHAGPELTVGASVDAK